MFVQQVARIVAISPSGFIPRVPRLYHVLRARCPAQKLGKCFFCTRCTVVAQACWCCLIPLAPHCLCTCWYQKERFARRARTTTDRKASSTFVILEVCSFRKPGNGCLSAPWAWAERATCPGHGRCISSQTLVSFCRAPIKTIVDGHALDNDPQSMDVASMKGLAALR